MVYAENPEIEFRGKREVQIREGLLHPFHFVVGEVRKEVLEDFDRVSEVPVFVFLVQLAEEFFVDFVNVVEKDEVPVEPVYSGIVVDVVLHASSFVHAGQ